MELKALETPCKSTSFSKVENKPSTATCHFTIHHFCSSCVIDGFLLLLLLLLSFGLHYGQGEGNTLGIVYTFPEILYTVKIYSS